MQHHQSLNADIREFLRGAFSGSAAHFERYVAEQVRCWGFPEFNPECRHEYQGFFNLLMDVFADANWSIEQLLTSDSEALVTFSVQGVHHEEFMGLPATGCLLTMRARLLLRVKAGQISESWMYGKSIQLITGKGKCFELQPSAEARAVVSSPLTSLCHSHRSHASR